MWCLVVVGVVVDDDDDDDDDKNTYQIYRYPLDIGIIGDTACHTCLLYHK